ncbi:MAG: hypothetical protein L6R41_001508 [Letrouitia leprolyta]|nr:MAG: hypothetical protein L6R41_001508 [Letrouitia leprolyta]
MNSYGPYFSTCLDTATPHLPPRLSNQQLIARYGVINVVRQPPPKAIQPQGRMITVSPVTNSVPPLPHIPAICPIDLTNDEDSPAQIPFQLAPVAKPVPEPSSAKSQGKRKQPEWLDPNPKDKPPRPVKRPRKAKAPVSEKTNGTPTKKKPAKEQAKKPPPERVPRSRPSKKQKQKDYLRLLRIHGAEFSKLYGVKVEDEVAITAVKLAGMSKQTEQDMAMYDAERVRQEHPERWRVAVKERRLREERAKEARNAEVMEEARTGFIRKERAPEPFRSAETDDDDEIATELDLVMEDDEDLSETDENELTTELERVMEDDEGVSETDENELTAELEQVMEKDAEEAEKEALRQAEREGQKRRIAEESEESSEEE